MHVHPLLHRLARDLAFTASRDGIPCLAVGAVAARDGRVLLVIRSAGEPFLPGYAELPGGGVAVGEPLLEALRRELREETGLEATRVGAYLGSFDYRTETGALTRQFNFLVEATPGEVALRPEEHSSHLWAAPGDDATLGVLRLTPETRAVLGRLRL